jgi:hypothetical protein
MAASERDGAAGPSLLRMVVFFSAGACFPSSSSHRGGYKVVGEAMSREDLIPELPSDGLQRPAPSSRRTIGLQGSRSLPASSLSRLAPVVPLQVAFVPSGGAVGQNRSSSVVLELGGR